MSKKLPPEVKAHIHYEKDVTTGRLDSFALAPRRDQLLVLAELRKRSAQEGPELTLIAILLAIVIPVTYQILDAPKVVGPIWAVLIAVFIVTLGLTAFLLLLFGIGPWNRHMNRVNALVWLPEYEEELRRRHAMSGRAARAWQRIH